MALTAASLLSKQFKTVRLHQGYDPQEVDTFLDEVHEAWTDTENRLIEASRRADDAARRADRTSATADTIQQPSMESMSRLLLVAEQTATEITAQAQKDADLIQYQAHKRAEDLVHEAEVKVREAEVRLSQIAEARRIHIDALKRIVKEEENGGNSTST